MNATAEKTHTPGSWKAETNEKSASISIYGKVADAERVRPSDGFGCIATVRCAVDPDAIMFSAMDPEQVANAHLMTAAPDMLAAIKEANAFILAPAEDLKEGVLSRLRAAIAKAVQS